MDKVTIIGAGPIGCYLAQILKKQGANPLLIEEHKELGKPVHCAGLVGKGVFEETQVPLDRKCISNTINGAVIHLDKDEICIRRKEVAYVVDREKFDKNLGKGLNILFETKFLGLERKKDAYIIETDKGDIETNIAIGADGAHSSVREFVAQNGNSHHLKGVQFRIEHTPRYKDMVEVYIKKPYFYWVIPESEKQVRVGIISHDPYQNLLQFIKEVKIKGKVLEKFAGKVPTTYITNLSRDKVFLAGDSASQLKPLTYGGIYTGMKGAEILAKCLLTRKFSRYSSIWMKKFGKEISMTSRAKEIFNRLPEEDIRRIFSFVKKKSSIIEKKGNFENHSSLIWEFLKDPGTSKHLVNILLKIVQISINKPKGVLV